MIIPAVPTQVYLPTIESCWDFGMSRNAPLLPFIGSLLPYTFLRGTQFDTKIFKLWDVEQAIVNNTFSNLSTGVKARNEVIFKIKDEGAINQINKVKEKILTTAKTTADGTPMPQTNQNSPLSSKQADTLLEYEVHIAVEGDSDLTASISNKWGAGEDILTQAIQGIAEIAKNVSEWGRTIAGISEVSDTYAGVPFSPFRYKGTDFGTITLSFTLFTRNNYIRDIYTPLNYLKSLCIPRNSSWAEGVIPPELKSAETIAKAIKAHTTEEIDEKTIQKGIEVLEFAVKKMGERYKIVRPPPTFSVSHSANLFFMKKAAITNFTYKPEGPWVRVEYDGLFGKLFSAGGINSSIGTALDRLIQDEYVKFSSYPDSIYPTRIKCSMTLQETEFITLNDYVDNEFNRLPKISVAIANSLTNPGSIAAAQIAGGIAQNVSVVTPNIKGAGDLLSGGKWVPPGESMSGIGSFF